MKGGEVKDNMYELLEEENKAIKKDKKENKKKNKKKGKKDNKKESRNENKIKNEVANEVGNEINNRKENDVESRDNEVQNIRGNNIENEMNESGEHCCCHQKTTPRSNSELKLLKNRLSRMVGQLNGIGKMLDENRYCGDVLNQVAAVESALQSFAYVVLQEHMETCVVEEIQKGNCQVIQETVELVKKLK